MTSKIHLCQGTPINLTGMGHSLILESATNSLKIGAPHDTNLRHYQTTFQLSFYRSAKTRRSKCICIIIRRLSTDISLFSDYTSEKINYYALVISVSLFQGRRLALGPRQRMETNFSTCCLFFFVSLFFAYTSMSVSTMHSRNHLTNHC